MSCDLCGFAGPFDPYFPEQKIFQCPSCALVFFSGPIDAKALYQADYFKGDEYCDYQNEKSILQRNFLPRIRALKRRIPGGRLFEVGCAYGYFLELARAHWAIAGTDISADAAAGAQRLLGVPVQSGDWLTDPAPEDPYDVICMWDTIEHLAQPSRYLQKAFQCLKPGGVIALTTGDIGSLLARWQGPSWRQIHPPTHTFYFSKSTLRKALEKQGFVLDLMSYQGIWRSWKGILHGLCLRHPGWQRIFQGGAKGSLDFPVYLNVFDTLFVIARKPA